MTPRAVSVEGFSLREGLHPAGSSLGWHRHPGATICFVYRGGFAERYAGLTLDCTPGTLKITPAEELHSNCFGREETRGLLIEADPAGVGRLGPHARVLEERATFHDAYLSLLGCRLLVELRAGDVAAPLAIEGLLLEVVASASRAAELRLRGTTPPRWISEARDLLHDAGGVRSLGELAEAVGVHPVTLARGFRKAYGCSVGAYLRRLRIARAAQRLAETDDALAEIALAAGFADQSHFSNLFRQETGISPSAFRRSIKPR